MAQVLYVQDMVTLGSSKQRTDVLCKNTSRDFIDKQKILFKITSECGVKGRRVKIKQPQLLAEDKLEEGFTKL